MKLAAGALADKGRKVLSNASGYVGVSDGQADTVVKLTSECTPGMAELTEEKMSISVDLDIEDVKKDAPPRATFFLYAKTEADAGECLAKITETFEPFKDMFEMMLGCAPAEFKQDGVNISISMSPPEEMLQMMIYSQED